jgi:transposase InsO family protein
LIKAQSTSIPQNNTKSKITEVIMISCDICGKEFKNTQGLRGHMNFIHSERADSVRQPVAQQATQQLLSSNLSTPVTTEQRLSHLGVKTLFIEPGSPWENGYIESFNGKLRDELLNREIFTTLTEARVLIE